jgi:transposase-like protein
MRERGALMTSKTRRDFTEEFKREAVLVLEAVAAY